MDRGRMNKKAIDYYLNHTEEVQLLIEGLHDAAKKQPSAFFLVAALEAYTKQIESQKVAA